MKFPRDKPLAREIAWILAAKVLLLLGLWLLFFSPRGGDPGAARVGAALLGGPADIAATVHGAEALPSQQRDSHDPARSR